MMVRTCLLISDDPDDYTEFSEALYEVAGDTVLIAVADLERAVRLLAFSKCTPEFVFLNRALNRGDTSQLFTILSRPELAHVKLFAWGGARDLPGSENMRVASFFDLDMTFVELKELLRNALGQP